MGAAPQRHAAETAVKTRTGRVRRRNLARRQRIGYRSGPAPWLVQPRSPLMSATRPASYRPIPRAAIARLWAAESERFAASNPRSRELAARARAHLPDGVPLHWMIDWQTPFPLF